MVNEPMTESELAQLRQSVNRGLESPLRPRGRPNSSTISSLTFTYDAQHRLTSQNTDGTLITYSYDATNQVTGDGNTTLTYDATGNRTTVTIAGNTSNYTTTTGNQLDSDGTWTYTYDDEGNMT